MRGIDLDLDRVPEALLAPLRGRADLGRAGNGILADPVAVELIARFDPDFWRRRAPLDAETNLPWLARARQFDDRIREFLSRQPDGTVVNLGAGLDTTFARIDNGRCRWFDLDLPEVIDLRRALIPETDRSTCVAARVLEVDWMNRLPPTEDGSLLFVAGGVLGCHAELAVAEWFREMGRRFIGAEIVFDAMTPAAVRKANRRLRGGDAEAARLRWGLKVARVLQTWPARLQVVEQFELFRGLDLRGMPAGLRVRAFANRLFRDLTVVRCRWI